MLHVWFDLDDTLIHCNLYYDHVLDAFAQQVAFWFEGRFSYAHIRALQQQIDLNGVAIHGFTADHFPDTLVETYRTLCTQTKTTPRIQYMEWLEQCGYSVYDSAFALYPDAIETLQALQQAGFTLSLYTGGNVEIQHRKVAKHGLNAFFQDRIYVAQHKNATSLEHLLHTHDIDRARTWMVGNSTRSDIVPAIQCGIGAVYVPPLTTWVYDALHVPPPLESARWLCAKRLRDVVGTLYACATPHGGPQQSPIKEVLV